MRTTRKEFVDTNLWVYANDAREPLKRDRARELLQDLRERTIVVSTQVMMEFYSIATRKLLIPGPEARSLVYRLTLLDVVDVSPGLALEAFDLALLHQLSHWDALIVAAARARRCSTIWTEDLNHGQRIDGIKIQNPFLV